MRWDEVATMEVSNNEHLTFGMVVVFKWFEEFSCWKVTKRANDIRFFGFFMQVMHDTA